MSAAERQGISQYLSRYASAERALADGWGERYRAALVVPAFCEAPGVIAQYRAALDSASGRVLVLVVVNANESNAAAYWTEHQDLLSDLQAGGARAIAGGPPAWLASHGHFDVLAIDRAHPDWCLPAGQGVGLARRIGCDLALALYAQGRLDDPFIYCSDADAALPAGYFDGAALGTEAASARLFSFWHVLGGDGAIDVATALYELGLRYYVAGLVWAGSPYAFHALGSVMAVRAPAYAAVRGFPKRLAGEDFYLLDKLAKVGSIARHDPRTVSLRSRASERTPHGTGKAALALVRNPESTAAPFYNPAAFELLRVWLSALNEFARTRDSARARASLASSNGADALQASLDELGAFAALESAAERCRGERALASRLHTWFDGFRTLKLLHALRDRGFPALPFRHALGGAPWCCSSEQAEQSSVDELRRLLFDRHASAPRMVGVAASPG